MCDLEDFSKLAHLTLGMMSHSTPWDPFIIALLWAWLHGAAKLFSVTCYDRLQSHQQNYLMYMYVLMIIL